MPYEVQTAVFEGPFDLLLHLILREQVDLYEVSLSTIVDAYLQEVERLDALDLEVATEFLLIAATLIELKSRRLLPGENDLELDEELALWSERDLLLARLLECKTFKDAARVLARLADGAGSLPAPGGRRRRPLLRPRARPARGRRSRRPPPGLPAGLRPPADPADRPRPRGADPGQRHRRGRGAARRAARVGRIGFRELTASLVERLDVVVRFLAILELFKQGAVDLLQARTFGDIQIVWLGVGEADDAPFLASLTSSIDVYEG